MTPEDLVIIHEIQQLKYRYMRAVDTQDWNILKTVFHKNAKSWLQSGAITATGRDNIINALSSAITPEIYSTHIAVHPEIELTSPTTAKGSWRFEDVVHFIKPNPALVVEGIKGGERLIGAGYFYDEYIKEDGQWWIASTGYVRIFDATESPDDQLNMKTRFEKKRGQLQK